ncbi:MAG: cytochrome c biogenesis protein ResB, partial [Actinomycetes bacterium]
MIRRAGHAIVGFFGSASLATGLLAVVAAWVVVAAFIPQGAESAEKVAAWAAAYPVLEPAVRAVGLHHAFSAPIFTGIVLALALCTAVCAWRRTTIAVTRARVLRKAAGADEASVTDRHDLEIACDPSLGGAEVLADASETLRGLGIKVKRRDGMLSSVSSPWSVWGSPVFHWALLVLMLAVLVGSLQRSEG